MIDIQTDGICAICGDDDEHLIHHHLAWTPEEITLPVCKACHNRIHHPNGSLCPEYLPDDEPPLEERLLSYKKRFAEANPGYFNQKQKEFVQRLDPEVRKERKRIADAKYYERHKEEFLADGRARYYRRKEENPTVHRDYCRAYRAKRLAEDPEYISRASKRWRENKRNKQKSGAP